MRHGEKEMNTLERDNFRLRLVPEAHPPLAALRWFFQAHGVAFSTVLSSPFWRCRETAAEIAGRHALEPGLCETLNESCGLRDGSGQVGRLETLVAKVSGAVSDAADPWEESYFGANVAGPRLPHVPWAVNKMYM